MTAGVKILVGGAPCLSGPFRLAEAERVGLGLAGGGLWQGRGVGKGDGGVAPFAPHGPCCLSSPATQRWPGATSLAQGGSEVAQAVAADALAPAAGEKVSVRDCPAHGQALEAV